ncbi:MAG: S8 family serine peptidase, partial [Deltaproteobacteria bacterium]|nr:S8 family serine peptidase [Deltaproteobacteria bacterium]
GYCRFSGKHRVLIGQSPDVLGYESNSGKTEVYVELPPFTGTWDIDFTNCSGDYHAKYGASSNVIKQWRDEPRDPTPTFGGRESDNAYTIGNPASANNVLAVAAYQSRNTWNYVYGIDNTCDGEEASQSYGDAPIDYYDPFDLGQLAYFSARGPRYDEVLKPEIAAPGVGIISAFSSHARALEENDRCTSYWNEGPYHYGTNRVLKGEDYTVLQGTSMACPNATGAVALFLEQKPDLTAEQLRTLFAASARTDATVLVKDSLPQSSGTDTDETPAVPNHDWGHGKLDIVSGLAELALSNCTSSQCLYDSNCSYGGTCTVSASLGTCSSCSGGCVATQEICDGLDNDCDGETDEGLLNACGGCSPFDGNLLGTSCGDCGTYECSGDDMACNDPGFTICGNCYPVPEEVCNGVDDDCDTEVDEGFGTLSCGVGECSTTVDECSGGSLQTCTPLPAPEANEALTCDDGKDNDCDGKTDGADTDCATSCGGKGDSCTLPSDCCSNNCGGPPHNRSCKK